MIRKRGNSYEVRAYNPTTKKSEYVGSRSTRAAARALEREAEDRLARSRLTGASTVADFAHRWLELYPVRAASSRKKYGDTIARFVRDFGERQLQGGVTRIEARAYVLAYPSRLSTVTRFYNSAIDAGLIHDNPFARLGIPRSRGRRDLLVLTDVELEQLAAHARDTLGGYGDHFAAVIWFAACTCVRPGEIFALEWDALDLGRQRAEIRYQRRRDGRARPKNGEPRNIVVPNPAVDAIRSAPVLNETYVFATMTGLQMADHTHRDYWERVRCAAGRPGMDFYELRHYGATKLLELGASAEDVAIQMGHNDGGELVRTTYGHPSHERALDRIQQSWLRGTDDGEPPRLQVV